MKNMMVQMFEIMKLLEQQIKVQFPTKEAIHKVPNSNHDDQSTIVNHLEFNGNNEQEFHIDGQEDELNMIEGVTDSIELVIDIAIDVYVKLTIDLKLKLILSGSVNEPTHFLARVAENPTEEVDKFNSFLFRDGVKAKANKSSREIEATSMELTYGVSLHISMEKQMADQSVENQLEVLLLW
ncbi:hypothetical protein J1N35_005150 [Gossypium stocksii]|uniref:Uncharacterized protein n=1 Tax=Gossypium stocksii TaxID=47602 RepID=A0A9D3WEP9_9ROSI|nr:hypothetical protein J1N35_005150 [Gossypium stocksii]